MTGFEISLAIWCIIDPPVGHWRLYGGHINYFLADRNMKSLHDHSWRHGWSLTHHLLLKIHHFCQVIFIFLPNSHTLSGHTALYWTMLLFWVFSHELENILSVILLRFPPAWQTHAAVCKGCNKWLRLLLYLHPLTSCLSWKSRR